MIVRSTLKAAVGFAAACSFLASPAIAGDYIVKFKNKKMVEEVAAKKSFKGYVVDDTHAKGALASIDLGKSTKKEAARALVELMADPDVEYVVENFKLETFGIPNDTDISKQWALEKVRAFEAWDLQPGAREVVVAVIDTGVNTSHPDLIDNVWTNPDEIPDNGIDDDGNGLIDDVVGWDFLENDNNPDDATSAQNPGHGTHCAGIVGAVGNNGQGISGMSQAVSLMALRFIGPTGQGDLMAAIKSIDYAIEKKVDVISASWGAQVGAAQAQPLIDAVGRADAAGIAFVAAAANNGANNDSTSMYPANADFPNVISVAASDSSDGKPSWSNFGKATVDMASPGLDIYSTLPGNKYGNLSGTSMATPLVAGLVALLKSHAASLGTELSGADAEALLQATGAQVQIETACNCRIDARAALDSLEASQLVVVPTAKTLSIGNTYQASAFGGSGEGYTYSTTDAAIAEVSASGMLTAKANGETKILVTDNAGNTATSLSLRVADAPEGGSECPLGDPTLCMLMCLLDPTLPWCQ